MLRSITKQKLTFALTAAFVFAGLPLKAQFLIQDSSPRMGAVAKMSGGEIDWGNEFYYASGEGALPTANEEPDRCRAYQKAKNDAKTKAIANLLMAVDATPVSYRTTAKDFISREAVLQQLVEECASNVEITGDKQSAAGAETIVAVTVRAPMYGIRGICSAILKSRLQHEDLTETSRTGLSIERKSDTDTSTAPASASGPFTSLIIDCSGLNMERALFAGIRRTDGTQVWTPGPSSVDALQSHGIITYVQRPEEAKRSSRAGGNPFIIRAIGRAGGQYMCDAVVNNADAQRISESNKTARFLDKLDVIFVVDDH